LASIWFWTPVLFGVYVMLQLPIAFYIHPLALGIVPLVVLYTLHRVGKKRFENRYGKQI